MLSYLTVRNSAIIDYLSFDFDAGMNCITGETGAGKSIIIDSICYLLGEKMSKDVIRRGASASEITGVFNVDDEKTPRVNEVLSDIGVEPEDDGSLILYRSYNDQGKNVCRVNDRIVTVSALKRLGEVLVDVHGQHDSHSLLIPQNHIKLLDAFAGKEFSDILSGYREKLAAHKETLRLIDELNVDPKRRAQLIDLLSFQVDEITAAALKPGEDKELEEKQKLIDNAEKISSALSEAYSLISGEGGYDSSNGAISLLDDAAARISSIEKYSEKYGNIANKIKEACYILEDCRDELESEIEASSFDGEEARTVEQRIDLIYDLKRKYGNSVDEIIAFRDDAKEKLESLLSSEETARKLLKKSDDEVKELRTVASKLTELRKKAAKLLTEGVVKALADIEMNKVKFVVDFISFDSENPEFKDNGLDGVEFLISANPGETPKPLSKIASGGELSRIMLAVKSCLADIDMIPVLIFDEIDTGISGSAAASVAEKFYKVSRNHQLICVTHLAPIAAISDRNVFVGKNIDEEYVKTEALILDEEGKIKEVGRLLDGSDDGNGVTRVHSIELIDRMRKRAASAS
ncbi:MAG: DNA repair protein RecN [Clostridia bacterium]|nr:DNA repair protein RecN [Clostridia bacterium]